MHEHTNVPYDTCSSAAVLFSLSLSPLIYIYLPCQWLLSLSSLSLSLSLSLLSVSVSFPSLCLCLSLLSLSCVMYCTSYSCLFLELAWDIARGIYIKLIQMTQFIAMARQHPSIYRQWDKRKWGREREREYKKINSHNAGNKHSRKG